MTTLASSVPKDTTSIKTEFVAKFKELANSSTCNKESVKSVMKATMSLMADAKKSAQLLLPMSDVLCGKTENVKLAPKDGSSMKIKYAFQLVISATPGIKSLEIVSPAIMDLLFKMEIVLPILILLLSLKATFSVKLGSDKPAKPALIEASSTKMDSVFQPALNVIPSTKQVVTALLALLDMTF